MTAQRGQDLDQVKGTEFRPTRRIAFVCFSRANGGLELSTIGLAARARRRSSEVILIVPPDSPMANSAKREDISVIPVCPHFKYGDFAASMKLARILRDHETDVVVLMQSRDLSIAAIANKVYPKTKIVLYQQMQFGLDKRDPIHSWMHSKLSLWITVTDRMKEEVLNHTRVAAERITVVPVGIDVRSYDPDRYDKIQARKFFDLPEDAAIVGTLSRLDPKKGIEDLLRAVPLVVERNKSVLLAIAGDETKGQVGYKDYLLRLCNDLGIDTHVRFLPFTSEVSRYLAALDLFILPSHSETFGFALIEAMAMRRAVIATDAGGVPEIVEHGKCGLLVPPQNSVRLSEAINSLLDDPEYRLELGKRARKRVVEAFDSEICVERFLASLDSLSPVRKGKLKEIGIFAWLLANQATYIIGGSTNLFTN